MMDEADRTDGAEAMPEAAGTDTSSPHAELRNTATPFAKKAKALEALRSVVIDTASVGASLWLSYLFVLFCLTIALGSITHRNLLFESPVKLPFLNVDLPPIGFSVTPSAWNARRNGCSPRPDSMPMKLRAPDDAETEMFLTRTRFPGTA